MTEAHKIVLDHLLKEVALISDPSSTDWLHQPVEFDKFVSNHLGLPPLTDKQYQVIITLLGSDPEKVFKQGSPYNILCMLAGKGSGKDYIASIVVSYVFYLLMCLRNPQAYFGSPTGESIDIVIVSYSKEQATLITFDKIKQRMKNWFWLRSKFSIILGDKCITEPGKSEIVILNDKVIAKEHNIRIISEHSANESYEGYNILMFVLSESCLRGRSLISLANETKMPIANIVNKRLPVQVLTRNMHTGEIEPRSVINWFKYPRTSHLIQIRVGHSKSWDTAVQTIQCTPNHHIYTKRGCIRADELQITDEMWVRGRFLSQNQTEFILGSLLGDAGFNNNRRHHASIIITHGRKQEAYLSDLHTMFIAMVPPKGLRWQYSGYNRDPHGSGKLLISSLSVPALAQICKRKNKKVITPEWVNALTLRSLAAWFMADGYTKWSGKYPNRFGIVSGSYGVVFSTNSFSIRGAKLLLRKLESMGYNGAITVVKGNAARPIKSNPHGQPLIRLNAKSSKKFLHDIALYMFPSMAYKNPFVTTAILLRNAGLVDDSSDHGLLPIQSIEIIESSRKCWRKSGTAKHRLNDGMHENDEWVYDIEVEGNHNYFAGDVLVSNSAFKSSTKERNGQKVYSTLRTSANSRFRGRWKGLVMSFPRYEEDLDFTYQLYNQRKENPTIYGVKGAPWEFLPAHFYSGHTFDYNGVQIPIEHKEEFDTVPEEAESKYLCYPARSGADVFTDDVIINGISIGRPPILLFKQRTEDKLIKMTIENLDRKDLFVHEYLLTIDLGKSHSAAAMSLQHIEGGIFVQDAIGAWTPDDSKGITIDMMDVKFWIIEVLKHIPRIRVAFDQWQSLILSEELRSLGKTVLGYHTYDRDYAILKKAMALNKVQLLDDVELVAQLKSIRDKEGVIRTNTAISKRIDKVDVTIGGYKILMEHMPSSALDEFGGYTIASNLDTYGGYHIK